MVKGCALLELDLSGPDLLHGGRRRARKGPQRANRDAGVCAEEARRSGEPIPSSGVSGETSGSAGDEDLQRSMAVNAGRSTGRGREGMERSRMERTSPGSRWRFVKVGEIAEQPELSAGGVTAAGGR
jgi:hypothetical protein